MPNRLMGVDKWRGVVSDAVHRGVVNQGMSGARQQRIEYRRRDSHHSSVSKNISIGETVEAVSESPVRVDLRRYRREVGVGQFHIPSVSQTLQTLSELPNIPRKNNLYYLVVPSGSGKTTISGKYGLLDVDNCCRVSKRRYLARVMSIMGESSDKTKQLAKEWLDSVRATIQSMVFRERTLILVHDQLTGYMIGGLDAGAVSLGLSDKLEACSKRSRESKDLIRMNHALVERIDDLQLVVDFEDFEVTVIGICNKLHIPIADPGERDIRSSELKIGREQASKMTAASAIDAYDKKLIGVAELIRLMNRNGCAGRGVEYTINDWAYSLSNGAFCAVTSNDTWDISLENFKESVNYSDTAELVKIMSADLADSDKITRLLWWHEYGSLMERKEEAIKLILSVPKHSYKSIFVDIGKKISKSRLYIDSIMRDSDRSKLVKLARCYGDTGPFYNYEEGDMEEMDTKSRYHRLAMVSQGIWLDSTFIWYSRACGIKLEYVSKMTDLAKLMDSWPTGDVLAYIDTIRRGEELDGTEHLSDVIKRQVWDVIDTMRDDIESRANKSLRAEMKKRPIQVIGMLEYVLKNGIDELFSLARPDDDEGWTACELRDVMTKRVWTGGESAVMTRMMEIMS